MQKVSQVHLATPPETPPKPGMYHLSPTSPWHNDEARLLLQDLSNFIPLGCLTSDTQLEPHEDALEWSELHYLPTSFLSEGWPTKVASLISDGWIRIFARSGHSHHYGTILRIYLLAGDVGHRFIGRFDKQARTHTEALRHLVSELDTSPALWRGDEHDERGQMRFDMWATPETSSLHWIFNNNPSPVPDSSCVDNRFRRQAMDDIMNHSLSVRGLKTELYPYQRRSATFMLQRESENRKYLDPRLDARLAPNGTTYYYCARDFSFFRHPVLYEAGKGGILAETMGLGKTLITLTLILATRCVLPRIPIEYSTTKTSGKVWKLMDLCVDKINENAVPWRPYFEDYELRTGESLENCARLLRTSVCSYDIPRIPIRFNRTTSIPPPSTKTLAATTIVVVPRNLCSQWQDEIEKHTEPGALKVLVMDDLRKSLPPSEQLKEYDIILFSRNRFEQESRDGSDEQGRKFSKTPLACACPYIGATRRRDCTCLRTDDIYHSPLKALHFLRIVIDEGHSFSSNTSMAATVAERLVTADHRWVVSGTPAKNLLGVEMDLYTSDITPLPLNDKSQREKILDQRKQFNAGDDTQGAAKSLGSLVTHFLQVRPWSGGLGEGGAAWDEYIYRHESAFKKTFTSFSRALRQTLEAVVIKTQPEDVERDMELPPLTHNIVKLEPSFYDKVTANLFTLVLTANAVLSERTDRDYIFHKDSGKARQELIGNLRQSAFFWTGFSTENVENTIELGEKYLAKGDINCSLADRAALADCIAMAKRILSLSGWRWMSNTHEFGMFVEDWPGDSAEHWTFDGTEPLLTGATLLADAQQHVHSQLLKDTQQHFHPQLSQSEPDFNLSGEGIRTRLRAVARGREETQAGTSGSKKTEEHKSELSAAGATAEPPKKKTYQSKKRSIDLTDDTPSPAPTSSSSAPSLSLPPDSRFHHTHITGTVSAKMSYLLSQISHYHESEKILVFYTGENAAYYLAQCLELLHIPHLIYARSLHPATKASYLHDFASRPRHRVMLMDVHQAAHGLNVVVASRVYFANPVCRPAVEAQAVKRAHRIGQTRRVVVETLVLRGGVEERIFDRARRMSRREHAAAKVLEDDGGVKDIVASVELVPLEEGGERSMAELVREERLWCRYGWREWFREGKEHKEKGRKKRATAAAVEGKTA